jgi:hypothetical protein
MAAPLEETRQATPIRSATQSARRYHRRYMAKIELRPNPSSLSNMSKAGFLLRSNQLQCRVGNVAWIDGENAVWLITAASGLTSRLMRLRSHYNSMSMVWSET